jgi:poly-gamma-glutamate synthesis protein (capsule biosynthesis protein)
MQDDLRILFTGDLSITGVFRLRVERGEEIFDQALLDLFSSHDFTVVNLEGPATARKNVFRPDIDVTNPTNTISYLVDRNIKIFNCANNHIFDCDAGGFTDTVQAIEAAGGWYFGAGADVAEASRPLRLSHTVRSVALVGVCNHTDRVATSREPGTFHDSSIAQVSEAIRRAAAESDYTVLNYHAGEEYTTVPMPSRRRRMLKFAELGADAIIGHHSHVTQGHERSGRCEIFYSLGNFVFDIDYLKTKQFTDRSALVSLTFGDAGLRFEFIPVVSDLERGIVKLGPPEFHDHLQRLSDFENYRTLWRQDAYRTLRQSGQKGAASPRVAAANSEATRRHPWSNLLSWNWYRHQYRRLANPNTRPIVLAACHEAFRKIFRNKDI